MNIGVLLIFLASAGLLISTISFFLAARGKERFLSLGYASYRYFVMFIALASGLLLYYFLSGDYSFRYVYEYSSSDLSIFYKISGFWAGQRGTYLLWTLMTALLGFYILKRGREYTAYGMFFYGLANFFFSVMLIVLSPFEKLGMAQADGAGLNPLLKDPWMVIHPPVIFLGYAAAVIPFAIALAALAKKKYDDWLAVSFGPVALTALMLAAGNIMGGFWAYKTLGWGGYWAWDPVENSSLIPWMTSLALLHGLLIERRDAALRKTNLFLALFTFLLVVYGTFLTRSGVLADFSVHSFVDLGVNVYLIGFMVLFIVISLAAFFARFGQIKGPSVNMSLTSQEFALLVSMWVLLLIALVVLAGTSWPLITTLFGHPETVDTAVYTRVTFPLAMVLGLFLGFSPFLVRIGTPIGELLKKVIPAAAIAVLATVLAYFAGVKDIAYLVFIFFASTAAFSNLFGVFKYFPGDLWRSGAQLSHFGFALMLIGILGSSAYSSNQKLTIDRGQDAEAYGLDITYDGMAGNITMPDNEIILTISNGSHSFEARPKLYLAQRTEGLMKKPYILRYFSYDLYLAPEQIQELNAAKGMKLTKGQSTTVDGYTLKFIGFEQGAHSGGGDMTFGAKIDVTDSAGNTGTTLPAMEFQADQNIKYHDTPLLIGVNNARVRLEKIFADEGAVQISIAGLAAGGPPDRLILEISKKPTMNVLWAGSIILVLGGLITLRKRWRMSA